MLLSPNKLGGCRRNICILSQTHAQLHRLNYLIYNRFFIIFEQS